MLRFFQPVLSVIALNTLRTVASDSFANHFFPLVEVSHQVNNQPSPNVSFNDSNKPNANKS